MTTTDILENTTLKELLKLVANQTYEADGVIYYQPEDGIIAYPFYEMIENVEDKIVMDKTTLDKILHESFTNGIRFHKDNDSDLDYSWWKNEVYKFLGIEK